MVNGDAWVTWEVTIDERMERGAEEGLTADVRVIHGLLEMRHAFV